jgi:hypothetical protein
MNSKGWSLKGVLWKVSKKEKERERERAGSWASQWKMNHDHHGAGGAGLSSRFGWWPFYPQPPFACVSPLMSIIIINTHTHTHPFLSNLERKDKKPSNTWEREREMSSQSHLSFPPTLILEESHHNHLSSTSPPEET